MSKEKITVRFGDEVPNVRYMPNHYVKLEPEQAYKFMIEGYCKQYDPVKKEESLPILDEDFPGRDKLFDAGIYTDDQVKKDLNNLKEVNGIGPKTYKDIKDRFSAERVMKIQEKARENTE